MNKWLAIAAYRRQIDGVADGTVDFQVRYFELPAMSDVEEALHGEPSHKYRNEQGEAVSWQLVRIFGIQSFLGMVPGDEIVGFNASIGELSALGLPDTAS